VDFTFSDEQEELRRAVRGWLGRHATPGHLRAMEDDPVGITDELWADLVALGWTSLLVPDAHGGGGGGLVDIVPVLEEIGRVPLPGPFSSEEPSPSTSRAMATRSTASGPGPSAGAAAGTSAG